MIRPSYEARPFKKAKHILKVLKASAVVLPCEEHGAFGRATSPAFVDDFEDRKDDFARLR